MSASIESTGWMIVRVSALIGLGLVYLGLIIFLAWCVIDMVRDGLWTGVLILSPPLVILLPAINRVIRKVSHLQLRPLS